MANRFKRGGSAMKGRVDYSGGKENVAKEAAQKASGGPVCKARGGSVGTGADKSPFSSASSKGGSGSDKHPFSSAHRG